MSVRAPGSPDNKPGGYTGIRRIWHAFLYSAAGLTAAFRFETAFRQELLLAIVLVPIAFWLPASLTQTALLLVCIFIVLIVELVNSAIEATVDRISAERHELAKRAKDIGSAAVLLSLANGVITWSLVLAEIYLGSNQ